MSGYHGHKTLIDGTHVPLSEDEAAALWKAADDAKANRAVAMPLARDALRAVLDAEQRLQELGWWRGGGLRVKRGESCAVMQFGSTGMWTGRIDEDGIYVHFCDCVSKPHDVWLKPLADLTDEESAHLTECDRREREAYSAMLDRYAAMGDPETRP